MPTTAEETLAFILKRLKITLSKDTRYPVEIPGVGRYSLAYFYRDIGFVQGAEIGVECGGYSEWLCKYNPHLHLYSIDPWKSYRGYRDHVSQSKLDGFYEETKRRLAPYNCTIIRKFSMDALKGFENDSLDFVFVDGNHSFVYCAEDVHWWLQKVRPGGIISGHDYKNYRKPNLMHVIPVINGYTESYDIRPWFVLSGTDVGDKDVSKTWFWIKGITSEILHKFEHVSPTEEVQDGN
jgi:hypothetical protein